jgi:hypothetical protein
MARITNVAFELGGNDYSLTIDFDDGALVDEMIAFDVVAERTGGRSGRGSLSARVEIIPAKRTIIVYVDGKEVLNLDGFNTQPGDVEGLVESIPAEYFFDPVTACAVKAGVSAIIGQSIECFRSLEDHGRWSSVQEFFRCMGTNFGQISKVAMYRAFRCIWRVATGT